MRWIGAWMAICMAAWAAAGEMGISASSVHPGGYPAEYALDGQPDTRWASQGAGNQWLRIDFGRRVRVEGLSIAWERAYAADYQVQVSDDGKVWRTVHRRQDGKGGRETIAAINAEGSSLRILCTRAGEFGLYSIWEVDFTGGTAAEAIAQDRQRLIEARRQREAETRQKLVASAGRVVFAARSMGGDGHWYANFAYYARNTQRKAYGPPGGGLYILDVRSGKVTPLLEDEGGSIRDPQVHYNGQRIVFAWRKKGTEHYNLYEIRSDGAGLRQITDGPWDDIEPCYLPDGGIAFVSSRCKRWVNCWLTQVAVLHRCDADGGNLRALSSNNEQDNTPWVLPDGRLLYQRWEYVDRSQVDYHHLWTMNPDGTGQAVYYGNMYPGIVMIDAKPMPGTDQVLATFSPGHGQREHEGPFYCVDPRGGPDDRGQAKQLAGRPSGRDPYPLDGGWVLYAAGRSLRAVNSDGVSVELYTDRRFDLHEPRPLVARPREPVLAPRVNLASATGKLVLADVHIGRNMQGVERGQIRKLLVMETLPKPINYTGGMDPLSYGGTFTLERIVGTVPVEEDGSACFEVPALRSFFLVALDGKNLSVKRMHSFLTVQPGETLSCVGCHEQRSSVVPTGQRLMALARRPSRIRPVPGVPDVIDFPRDVQPILDRHCVSCHDYEKRDATHGPRAGGVVLSGDRGPMFSHSYVTLTLRREFVDGRNEPVGNRAPRTVGSSASPLMKRLDGSHYGARLSAGEIDIVRLWIDSGAAYPGTYAALGTGMIGGYDENNQVGTDSDWPASKSAAEAIARRCGSCHTGAMSLPRTLSDENGLSFWRPDWNDPRLHRSRHMLFNLTRPAMSLALLAPLARSAGGLQRCVRDGKAVFAGTDDADYRKIMAMAEAGKKRLEEIRRFDMPGFAPDPAYIREMMRFGVLPPGTQPEPGMDVYAIDQRYWRSLWHPGTAMDE